MRKLFAVCVSCLALVALAGASPASAATEFGDPCTADSAATAAEYTIFGVSSTSSPLPLAAPSAGVITSWKLNLITPPPPTKPIPVIYPQTLKVLRLNTAAKTAEVVGESHGVVGSGANTVPSRIPVQAGDHLALFEKGQIEYEGSASEVGPLFCAESAGPGDVVGLIEGSSPSYKEQSELRVPVVAVLEPDVDNDGYGDETQDRCPQSAATHDSCPVVTLDTVSWAGKRSVSVYVATSLQAPVHVSGSVKLRKGGTATLDGGTQTVPPGQLVSFKLTLTKKIVKRLKELPRSKKLNLAITADATNVAGQVSTDSSSVKLKGLKK